MKSLFTLILFLCAVQLISAQKKTVSFEQAFEQGNQKIIQPLPQVIKWLDDEHYVARIRDEKGKSQDYKIKAATGEKWNYQEDKTETAKDFALPKDAKNLTWSPDGSKAAYTINNNLFVIDRNSEIQTQLTFDGSKEIKNGYASWVYFEEILGRGSRYRAFWWSPDSKKISFMRFDDSQVPQFPIYVVKDQHGYLETEFYPKAGDKNPEVKIGIVDLENNNQITWADFNPKDDQYFGTPYWTPTNRLWVQWMNRGQDNLKIYEVDLKTGSKKEIYDEKQSTWVDLDQGNRLEFLPDEKGFIVRSDKDGWAHYYYYDMSGKLKNRLTTGEFTVGNIYKVDLKNNRIFFNARKENSTRWDLYSVSLEGKNFTRHSFGDFSFAGMNISPNNKYFVTSYSNLSTPATMVVMDMKGKVVKEIATVRGEEFNEFALPQKKLFRVKSFDGQFDLPVTITYPLNFDPNKRYPVLISIYGGPNAGRILDTWSTSALETWWAQEGLLQVVIDNRSSGHFGKKGMNFIHRQMGKYEIEDYMAAGKWLRSQSFVDTNYVGITGGSFGGYLTCLALTYGADVFTHGIANAAVTDWQFYDTHYTERYMDAPQENREGYKLTSVMTYADRLKGVLRIVHGTSDDNVHMQNSLVLINRLQDLKKHFEFMLYPGERHGIGANNPAKGLHNRTEAYQFFYEKLLRKPVPEKLWEKKGAF